MNKLSIGLVSASVAVLVLVGGNAADAGGLLTGKNIKDGSLTLKDFKASEVAKLKGPKGAPGAQGPAGSAAALNTVTVESPDTYVAANSTGSVIAYCPAGKKALGGGYFSSVATAVGSMPTGSATGVPATSWGVIIGNTTSIGVTVNAYVVCA